MKILSCFDGIACGRVALDRAGINVSKYLSFEIDKYAMHIANKNYPDIVQLGDITSWRDHIDTLQNVDLLLAGSPCQGLSFAGKGLAFDDPRSRLFFEFVEILRELKPKYFLLENVVMSRKNLDFITRLLGVDPVLINSALVSAQNRKRYYWCNWPVRQPTDRGIMLDGVLLERGLRPSPMVGRRINENGKRVDSNKSIPVRQYLEVNNSVKSRCLSTVSKDTIVSKLPVGRHLVSKTNKNLYRNLTPVECERLQTLPDNYTAGVSDSQRLKALGNGWTVDVIAEILKWHQ